MREAISYLLLTVMVALIAMVVVFGIWHDQVDSLGRSIDHARERYNAADEPTKEDVEEIRRLAITRADYLTHKPFLAMDAQDRERYNDACALIRRCNAALVTFAQYAASPAASSAPAAKEPWFMKPESALDKRHRR